MHISIDDLFGGGGGGCVTFLFSEAWEDAIAIKRLLDIMMLPVYPLTNKYYSDL